MSGKRLNKRQLREQQELEELADVPLPTQSSSGTANKSPFQQLDELSDQETDQDDDEEEQAAPVASNKKPTTTFLFAALGEDDPDQENDDDDHASEPDQDISTQQIAKSSKKKN